MNDQQLISIRPYLFKVAYGMLGVVEEAEDIVQDAYAHWLEKDQSSVEKPGAYLSRMVVNRSIDRLNQLKRERETYKGFWLPEPYITLEAPETTTIDYGLLILLEQLNPIERAIFILRESFSESYEAIAEMTGLSEDNCRQVLHRAKQKIQPPTKRGADPAKLRELTEAFLIALHQQDRSALEELLRSDIRLYGDGGGKKAASLKPLTGVDKVLKFLFGVSKLEESADYTYRPGFINGSPGALIYSASTGIIDSALFVEYDEEGIAQLNYVRNPDKLQLR